MSILSPRVWLQVAAMLLAGASGLLAADNPVSTRAYNPGHFTPFGPVPEFHDMEYQWFEEPDLSEYGCDRPDLKEGFFFSYDRLIWAFQSPKKIDIGDEANERVYSLPFDDTLQRNQFYIVFQNDIDTKFIETDWVWGNRFELGYIVDDTGWLASTFHAHTHHKRFSGGFAQMVFNDPFFQTFGFVDVTGDNYDDDLNNNNVYGRPINGNLSVNGTIENFDPGGVFGFPVDGLVAPIDYGDRIYTPVIFASLTAENHTTAWSVELMKLWRLPRLHYGGVWEWMLGARYFNMRDQFDLLGTNDPTINPNVDPSFGTVNGGILDEFLLNAEITNNAVGPQIGARWSKQTGRWIVSTEGRFTAAVNFEQACVQGHYATKDPTDWRFAFTQQPVVRFPIPAADPNMVPHSFTNSRSDETFAPIGELRLNAHYQLTKVFALKMGYTGIVAGGMGRATRRIDYTLPDITIRDDRKSEAFITNGFDFGFEMNR
jgi:Putative beta barrel porin-7 (BBP7)